MIEFSVEQTQDPLNPLGRGIIRNGSMSHLPKIGARLSNSASAQSFKSIKSVGSNKGMVFLSASQAGLHKKIRTAAEESLKRQYD